MTKTEAAKLLARHVLTEAVARGDMDITDKFARDVIAEAPALAGTRYDYAAQAAAANPALSRVKAEARRIIERAQRRAA